MLSREYQVIANDQQISHEKCGATRPFFYLLIYFAIVIQQKTQLNTTQRDAILTTAKALQTMRLK